MLSRPRIVIFERNAFCRALMLDLVATNDMVGLTVRSPSDLSRVGQSERLDVLVVDFDGSGREVDDLVRTARALPEEVRPRLVAMVTSTNDIARRAIDKAGVDDVIVRPIDTGKFARSVKRQALLASGLAAT